MAWYRPQRCPSRAVEARGTECQASRVFNQCNAGHGEAPLGRSYPSRIQWWFRSLTYGYEWLKMVDVDSSGGSEV